ncbi:trehalase-like domain-containing protein [Streptomyces sp. DHE17-7]|uniref:trehalase-like domain-containing protein n=1 Tax=Streptomyces sp. DHE17-7 TaxID=2759949 RepID=UPI003FA6D8DF
MRTPNEDSRAIATQTAALVGTDGSVDWLCLPRFDSAACFARLLGDEDNGHWRIAPEGAERCTRRAYRPDTLVLDTEWETADGAVRVTDFMPQRDRAPDLVRVVEGLRGEVTVHSVLRLRFDYGSVVPWMRRTDGTLGCGRRPDTRAARCEPEVPAGQDSDPPRIHGRRGREGRLRPHLASLARAPPAAGRPVHRPEPGRDGGPWAAHCATNGLPGTPSRS